MMHLLLIVLYFLDGTPDPHTFVVPEGVTCDFSLAEHAAVDVLKPQHTGMEAVVDDFQWQCMDLPAAPGPKDIVPKRDS